jgi:hypothetical protein
MRILYKISFKFGLSLSNDVYLWPAQEFIMSNHVVNAHIFFNEIAVLNNFI